jgi:hypothetical protein
VKKKVFENLVFHRKKVENNMDIQLVKMESSWCRKVRIVRVLVLHAPLDFTHSFARTFLTLEVIRKFSFSIIPMNEFVLLRNKSSPSSTFVDSRFCIFERDVTSSLLHGTFFEGGKQLMTSSNDGVLCVVKNKNKSAFGQLKCQAVNTCLGKKDQKKTFNWFPLMLLIWN